MLLGRVLALRQPCLKLCVVLAAIQERREQFKHFSMQ